MSDAAKREIQLTDILNEIYAAAVVECEGLEHRLVQAGGLRINGHHMAQRIVMDAEKRLREHGLGDPSVPPPPLKAA